MKIAFTQLELTLLASFNIYSFIKDEQSKEQTMQAIDILISVTKEDEALNNLLLLADAILNNTLMRHMTDLMMEEEPSSPHYRTCERLIINYRTGVKCDKDLLQALYAQLIQLSCYQTNGNESLVIDAMQDIEAKQEMLY